MEGFSVGAPPPDHLPTSPLRPPCSIGCSYWFVSRSEYGGTQQCPDLPDRPPRTCFVNLCLCSADLTHDPTLITVLPSTNTLWYDQYLPDVWVPNAIHANSDLLTQYAIAYVRGAGLAQSAPTGGGGPRLTSPCPLALARLPPPLAPSDSTLASRSRRPWATTCRPSP